MWLFGIGTGARDLTFNVSHWILAWEYLKISDVVPKVLEGTAVREKTKPAQYWILMVLNILFPVLETVAYI